MLGIVGDGQRQSLREIYTYINKFQKENIGSIGDDDQKISLWHYTTISGMRGIIESEKIWLSDSRFMNDSEELRHASKIIGDVLGGIQGNSRIDDKFRNNFISTTKNQRNYIACFCEDGDLLSQWRGYGNAASPVSLNFLFKLDGLKDYYLAKVIYDDNLKEKFIKGFIEFLDGKYGSTSTYDDANYKRDLKLFLMFAKNIIKHSAFSEENEWRLGVYALDFSVMGNGLKFRESPFGLTPYVEFDLNQQGRKIANFVKVIQGPRLHKTNAEDALSQYFAQKNMPSRVERTNIPLRKY